jgi:UDP-N-acetylmuramate dehydrogenase
LECEFSYRHSRFFNEKTIILSVKLYLEKGNKEEIQQKVIELAKQRKEKQPLEYPNAGSTFKRPEGYFAAKLIEDCGLKGLTLRGAQVSDKHCGFVVNLGGAQAKDILDLIYVVKITVYSKFGVMLEEEVKILGEE